MASGGANVTPSSGLRKLVAVMSADFASYTALMERAELPTHLRLMSLMRDVVEPAIATHVGSIVKSTGDGFLAMFDAAGDAVDCGLRIQERLAEAAGEPRATPLLLRIGINIANAIVEPNDIFGDDVNLAARLQAAAEPGGIVVSKSCADQVSGRSGVELADLGELSLKHVSRPVRAFRVATSAPPRFALAGAPSLPDDRPSIAVLPFRVQSTAAEDGWFADGIVEAVVHRLAGIEDLLVIGHGASLAYAESPLDRREIGAALGVRFLLTGGLRRVGARMTLTAELLETATGKLIRPWRFEAEAELLLDATDRVVGDIVACFAPALRHEELTRAKWLHPDSMTCYDLVLQAFNLMYSLRRSDFELARGMLQQAMAYDPLHGPACSHAAMWHLLRIAQGWSNAAAQDVEDATRFSTAALERTHSDPVALSVHGFMLAMTRRDLGSARYYMERARAAGPTSFIAWTLSSVVQGWSADGKVALDHAQHAMTCSPYDPQGFFAEFALGLGHYAAGEYEQAVAWGRRSASGNGLLIPNLRVLAGALVGMGDLAAAREVADRLMTLNPHFSLSQLMEQSPLAPGLLARHVAFLRQAGMAP